MQRKYQNAGLGGTAAGSAVLWLVWMLDQIGRVETARDLYSSVGPFAMSAIIINWPVVYFWIFVFSVAFLFAVNIEPIKANLRHRRSSAYRHWDMTFSDAAIYVSKYSYFSDTLTGDIVARTRRALDALAEAVKAGSIKVAGTVAGSSLPTEVSKRKLANLKVSFSLARINSHEAQINDVTLVKNRDARDVQYDGLMLQRSELQRVFPTKSSGY